MIKFLIKNNLEKHQFYNTKTLKIIMNPNEKNSIKIGQNVEIVLKKDQKTGKLTKGIVKEILTNSSYHPHGIKVKLENNQVGRVKKIN